MDFAASCPIPLSDYPHVLMAHGGGGRLMQQLIDRLFMAAFGSPDDPHDAAVLTPGTERVAFTTDSFVVRPLFFPGGDIGSLAVHGTVNDLAMRGARPMALSCGFILEEGLPMETLWGVAKSMGEAAHAAGVRVVTGDTKVVERGKGDGIYINTSGVGCLAKGVCISPSQIQPGDTVLVSGDLGRHGMAIMAAREGLEFESAIESDSAPLWEPVAALLEAGVRVHCLRDLTRGGLTSTLNEIAQAADCEIAIEERAVPVREDVQGACEILGFDPFSVANEGRFAAFIDPADTDKALEILTGHAVADGAAVIGEVRSGRPIVTLKSLIGATRILDMLSGEQLPRIC
ncbi:hydrogenase expression/formation protein HypE [bacterium]|nr:hydrogenase expression/formation protein HypE [bacterium]